MTTVYVDFVSGSDGTGDGSSGNPYQSIAFADNTLGGGDEIRVAKTPVQTASGTMTWTDKSVTINTTNDETGNIAVGDAICKTSNFTGSEGWYCVDAIDASSITLITAYDGATETVATYYLHDAAAQHDSSNRPGTSSASRLKITGGWDLTGPTRDGYTYMFQNGAYYTLSISAVSYIEIAYFVISGPDSTAYMSLRIAATTGSYIHHLFIAGNGCNAYLSCTLTEVDTIITTGTSLRYGIEISYFRMSSMKNVYVHRCASSTYYGFSLSSAVSSYFENVNSYDHGTHGLYLSNSYGNYFKDCTFDGNARQGIYIVGCSNNFFTDCTISNNTQYGIYFFNTSYSNIFYNPTFTNNTLGDTAFYTSTVFGQTVAAIITSAGVHTSYGAKATLSSDTTDARSGKCLKYSPTDADEPDPPVTLGTVKVASTAADITLKIYIKKDATFNGQVYLIAVQDAKLLVQATEKTPTTSYAEYSIVVSSADLTLNSYVDLLFFAVGTTGNIFFDDFSWSQS